MKVAVGVIKVGKKNWAIVDVEDFEKLAKFKWSLSTSHGFKYAKINNIETKMHRLILSAKTGEIVDHKNGNTLDNRKENLRLCTYSQNASNKKMRSDSKTGVKGVSFHKEGFRVRIVHNGKRKTFGPYDTLEKAKQKYIEKSLEFHKDFSIFDRKGG